MPQPTQPGRRHRRSNTVSVAELLHRERPGDDPADPTNSTDPTGATDGAALETTGPLHTDWFEADPPEQSRFTEESYPAARIPALRRPADAEASEEDSADDDFTDDDTADEDTAERTGPLHALTEDPLTGKPLTHAERQEPAPSSKLATAGRIAGLVVGLMALGGAMTVAQALEQHEAPGAAPVRHPEITGLEALRPDAVADRLGDAATGFAFGPPARKQLPADTDADAHPHSPTGVVERFYALAAAEPAAAADLLEPGLLGTHRDALLRSWRPVRRVLVERISAEGDDSVQVTVRVQGADGRWLRMRQELDTAGTDTPLINTVRVLSAQYG